MKCSNLTMAAALCALGVTGCMTANDSAELANHESGLINAPLDTANPWAVGVCSGPLNTDPNAGELGACGGSRTRCTGSLIARNLVLTARHCIYKVDASQATNFCDRKFTTAPITTSPVLVTTDPSVLGANVRWREVDQILTPAETDFCRNDLAILVLRENISLRDAKPIQVGLADLTRSAPDEVAIVGRGLTFQRFDTTTGAPIEQIEGGLTRRILQHIPVECVSNQPGDCVAPDIGIPFEVDPGYLQVGAAAVSGDSGSGLIRQRTLGRIPVVIAVESALTVDPVTGLPNYTFGTRLDLHAKFIQNALTSY